MRPDSGEAFIDGLDIKKDFKKIRSRLGYMPGRFSLYQDLSVEENLTFFATIFGTSIEENYHLIADIYKHIEPFKKRQAGKLSGGMKQKLALSCALIHHPSVLFLDEPTTGVDAVSRKEFWDMLKKLKKEGITIMVSTPYMDEAILCDRVALMQKGSIMGIDTPQGIINAYPKELFAIKSMDTYALLKDLRKHPDCYSAFSFGGSVHFSNSGGRGLRTALYEYLIRLGHKNVIVEPKKAGIEDCFMYLMSKNSAQ
jgi:ABC-type multidrug transport system ATPase subunit